MVGSFLRMGSKYDIEVLRKEALERLFYENPSTLEELDNIEPWSFIAESHTATLDIASLAREQGLHSILPIALYWCCCNHMPKELLVGLQRADGTIAAMPPDNLTACLAASVSLSHAQSQTTLAWMNQPQPYYPSCKSPIQCAGIRNQAIREVYVPYLSVVGLKTWDSFLEWMDLQDNLCKPCTKIAEKIHEEGRAKFWDGLPRVFDLPGWDELRKDRKGLMIIWCVIVYSFSR